MANLNFEQPPRSIANASLTSRAAGGGGGLNTSTLTGHVTPTSGMFSGSSANTSSTANSTIVATNVYPGVSGSGGQSSHQQQQQLSPMGSRGLFGQRAFTDRRTMPALGLVSSFSLLFSLSIK
jgi:CCR4-NOT transcription complex subunit 2